MANLPNDNLPTPGVQTSELYVTIITALLAVLMPYISGMPDIYKFVCILFAMIMALAYLIARTVLKLQ